MPKRNRPLPSEPAIAGPRPRRALRGRPPMTRALPADIRPAKLILVLLVLPLTIAAVCLGLVWLLTKEFEFGAGGPQEWMFVRGTLTEQLGAVDPAPDTPLRYTAAPQDGTAPA